MEGCRVTDELLTIGEVAGRTGVATSALRFYESKGLISSTRTEGNQRRFARSVIRVVSVIRAAQAVGITLEQIRSALDSLPAGRTPTRTDWARLSRGWRDHLDKQIAELEALREDLTDCIGCGCLSLTTCALYNPSDWAARNGAGPRYLLGDQRPV
jgi:MerR family redox-sensitive transcriptional activator SoxR